MVNKKILLKNLPGKEDLSLSSNRIFGLVFSVVFILIGTLPLIFGYPAQLWSLALSGLFLILAMVKPRVLGPFNYLWTRFGFLLHSIVSPITLAVLFFGVVMPIGLFMRLIGHDPMRLKFDGNLESYWIKRVSTKESESSSMINQF